MVKTILFIEGTKDTTNGSLRQGFNKLLSQKLGRNLPKIIMGDSAVETKRAFLKNELSKSGFLLIDLDDYESEKEKKLKKYNLENHKDSVFFMIQEMEAWFLSQPDIINRFYKTNIFTKKVKKNHKTIENPDIYLQKLTNNIKRKKYHKVKHGVKLLTLLNADKLEKSSSEFKTLIEKLRTID